MNEALQKAIEGAIASAERDAGQEILRFIADHAARVVGRFEQSEA